MSIAIGLVQYNSAFRHFLPYSVGLLQAYAQRYAPQPERYTFLLPRVFHHPLQAEVQALRSAQIVAFSAYIWNIQRCLALAMRLKAQNPEVWIIFGGPQVPERAEDFLRAHPQVDLCCHGEGEATFLALLESFPQRDWQGIAGLSWLDAQGGFQQTPKAPRRKALEELPSPYLSGVFEPLLAAHSDVDWAALWETNRGCPFTCTFCDWGSATQAKVNRFELERLQAELDWFAAKQVEYIFCCDANFGILRRDLELAKYAAQVKRRTGYPGALAVQNAKNVSERTFEVQCILAESGLDSHVTLSLQSLHPPTLTASGRANISLADFAQLQNRLRQQGIHTYTDLILGLPEETYDSFAQGLATVIEQGQYYAVNVFAADIMPNAPMADPAYMAHYGLETVRIPSVSYHTPVRADPDGIVEFQQLVISTRTLSRAGWVRAQALFWLTQLLFFKPGTLRLPLLLLQHAGGQGLHQALETFLEPGPDYPLLSRVSAELQTHAQAIQQGQPVFVPLSRGQGQPALWHTANEQALARLVHQGELAGYYQEAEQVMQALWQQTALPQSVLEDALFHSAAIVHLQHGLEIFGAQHQTRWNVWDYYQGLLAGQSVELQPQARLYYKDWQGQPHRLRWRWLEGI